MRQASVFDYQLLYWFSAWDNALQNTPASAFSPFSSRPFPLPLPYALGPFSSSPFLFLFAFVRLCKSKGALFCLKEHCSVCTVLCHLLVSVNGRCGGVVFSFFFGVGGIDSHLFVGMHIYHCGVCACVVGLDIPPLQRTVVHWKVHRPDLITVSLTAVVGLGQGGLQCSA